MSYASPPTRDIDDWHDPIWALACGAMLCVPFITGLMALVFGISAVSQSRPRGQRFVALLGLLLGAINLVVWNPFLPWGIAYLLNP